ncbi:MAG: hypothetical protein ACI8XO_004936 [Verrucomicrobiales bacterium]|jgi:hypothetical protein
MNTKIPVLRFGLAILTMLLTNIGLVPAQGDEDGVGVEVIGVRCPAEIGGVHRYLFEVHNHSVSSAHWLRLRPVVGITAVSPDAIRLEPALGPGASQLVEVELADVLGGEIALTAELTDARGLMIAETTSTSPVPACDCIEIVTELLECTNAVSGAHRYSATLRNRSGFDMAHLLLLPLDDVEFETDHFEIDLTAGGGETFEITTTLTLPPRGRLRVMLTAHDRDLQQCCSVPVLLQSPCQPDPAPRQIRGVEVQDQRLRLSLSHMESNTTWGMQYSPDLRSPWIEIRFAVAESRPVDALVARGGAEEIFVPRPAGGRGYFRVVRISR